MVKSENELAEIESGRQHITKGKSNSNPQLIDEKYKSSTINEEQKEELQYYMISSMVEQKLYKDKNLTSRKYKAK